MSASREAERLAAYAALIRKWNPAINLVAPSTLIHLEQRHIADSLQLADNADQQGAWLDLGSGGGLPAIPLAIRRPNLSVMMLDSDQRKVAFLRTVIRQLDLSNATALCGRIEEYPPQSVANISARALAPLDRLLPLVARHLAPGGTAWLLKGQNWPMEVEVARKSWHFELVPLVSSLHPDSAILKISDLSHG